MDHRELMRLIAVATGLSVSLSGAPGIAQNRPQGVIINANPQGFDRSGNPRAACGPDNPGLGVAVQYCG